MNEKSLKTMEERIFDSYSSEHLKRLKPKMIVENLRDTLGEKLSDNNYDLEYIDDNELNIISRLNRLHKSVDSIVRHKDGELFILKMFAINNETGKRMMIIKSMSDG